MSRKRVPLTKILNPPTQPICWRNIWKVPNLPDLSLFAGRDIASHHMSRKRVPLPKFGQTQSDSDLQAMEEQESDSVTLKNSSGSGINSSEVASTNSSSNSSSTLNSSNSATGQASTTSIPISKKLSRITLRKLKIWWFIFIALSWYVSLYYCKFGGKSWSYIILMFIFLFFFVIKYTYNELFFSVLKYVLGFFGGEALLSTYFS